MEEATRAIGGILFGLGVLLALDRKSGHGWTSFELMLLAAVPCVILFVTAVAGAASRADEPPEPWRALLLIASIALSPVALLLFLNWAGASTRHLLYDAGVLLATALLALIGRARTRAPYALLLAGVALLGAWMLVWVKLFGGDPSASTVRLLLLGGGAVLMASGALRALAGRQDAGELVTAGGIGAVGAGLTGVLIGLLKAIVSITGSGSESVESSATTGPNGEVVQGPVVHHLDRGVMPVHGHLAGGQSFWWDLMLLAVSVALLWMAARGRNRGLGYVGGFGLVAFLESTGTQLARLEAGHSPSHSLFGWPLALALVGLAGLGHPYLRRLQR